MSHSSLTLPHPRYLLKSDMGGSHKICKSRFCMTLFVNELNRAGNVNIEIMVNNT